MSRHLALIDIEFALRVTSKKERKRGEKRSLLKRAPPIPHIEKQFLIFQKFPYRYVQLKKKMFETIYIYNYNSQNIEISIPIFLDPLPFLVLQLHPSKIFSTTTTTPVLEAEKARLVQALPAIMAACLARASPAKSSPSYNLLVNFASLLEGYVRWDKKYLERERERETRYSSSGRAYQAPSSSHARVTDILCRCAQPASQTVYLERW